MKLYVSLLVALYLYTGIRALLFGTGKDVRYVLVGAVMYFPVFGRILGYW